MVRGPSAGRLYRAVAFFLLCVGVPGATAQPGSASDTAVVSAFVWSAANRPVANVTLALRNLDTARVDRTTNSDQDGHADFRGIPSGTYVLEVADAGGVAIATGQTFHVGAGETLVTFVRLPAKSPWYAGLFRNAGAIAVATAAGLGTMAVGTTGQPRSPGR